MDFADSHFFDGGVVRFGAVPFMDFEAVAGIFFGETAHEAVTMDFGDDGGDFDCGEFFITLDDGLRILRLVAGAKEKTAVQTNW